MKTLLTFLGTGRYSTTTYVLGDQRHESCYCPAAIAHFVQPELMLVVVTEAASAHHYNKLALELDGVTKVEAMDIPDGHSEADLWAIFDALTSKIGPGTELVVDITNGFRSLPFLSFLAIAFLRVAKDVAVQAVYYGAWDARSEANESPVFDLTPFVTLLDWTAATDQFMETGDSTPLAARLRDAHRLPWQNALQTEHGDLPRHLQLVATTLERLGQAQRLARPEDVMMQAHTLQTQLADVRFEAETWAKPFHLLLDRTAEDYAPLAFGEDPRTGENVERSLEAQRALTSWYVERRQYVQAIVLAREWVVSFVTLLLEWDLIKDRRPAEELLNTGIRLRLKNLDWRLDDSKQPAMAAALNLWSKLPDLRNDIAHTGMRAHPRSVTSITQTAQSLPAELEVLSQFLGEDKPLPESQL